MKYLFIIFELHMCTLVRKTSNSPTFAHFFNTKKKFQFLYSRMLFEFMGGDERTADEFNAWISPGLCHYKILSVPFTFTHLYYCDTSDIV